MSEPTVRWRFSLVLGGTVGDDDAMAVSTRGGEGSPESHATPIEPSDRYVVSFLGTSGRASGPHLQRRNLALRAVRSKSKSICVQNFRASRVDRTWARKIGEDAGEKRARVVAEESDCGALASSSHLQPITSRRSKTKMDRASSESWPAQVTPECCEIWNTSPQYIRSLLQAPEP
jgi:hypothetical protein